MKKLGGLKERTLPSHGKSVGTSEPKKFLNLPKAGRGEQGSEFGKKYQDEDRDHGMSAREVLGDLMPQMHDHMQKVGLEEKTGQTKFDVDSSTKGLRK